MTRIDGAVVACVGVDGWRARVVEISVCTPGTRSDCVGARVCLGVVVLLLKSDSGKLLTCPGDGNLMRASGDAVG